MATSSGRRRGGRRSSSFSRNKQAVGTACCLPLFIRCCSAWAFAPIRAAPLCRTKTELIARSAGHIRRREQLTCKLTPLSFETATRLLPLVATRDQWTQYWGRTEVQRAGKIFEAAVVTFLGLWACYFTSFFMGAGLTSILGAGFAFYWLLGPSLSAYRKNRTLRGRLAPGRDSAGGVAGLFSARVTSVQEEYNPVTRRALRLLLLVEDEDGRALQFRVSMAPEYRRIRQGMRVEVLLLATDPSFTRVVGVSDAFIPAADVWVGEYPYLERLQFRRLLASRYGASRLRERGRDRARDAAVGLALDDDRSSDSYEEDDDDEDGTMSGGARGGGGTAASAAAEAAKKAAAASAAAAAAADTTRRGRAARLPRPPRRDLEPARRARDGVSLETALRARAYEQHEESY
ncbi:unnamed protein product [Phaeothamnion confervicola]